MYVMHTMYHPNALRIKKTIRPITIVTVNKSVSTLDSSALHALELVFVFVFLKFNFSSMYQWIRIILIEFRNSLETKEFNDHTHTKCHFNGFLSIDLRRTVYRCAMVMFYFVFYCFEF